MKLQWQIAHQQFAAGGFALRGWPINTMFPLELYNTKVAKLNLVPGKPSRNPFPGFRMFDTDEGRAVLDAFRAGRLGFVRQNVDGML